MSRIRIKDIAVMAGVSAGTVDRILHNRGNVSAEARKAVEAILEKVNYKPNIYVSSLSLKKTYRLVVTIPRYQPGDYWYTIHVGVERAMAGFERLSIECETLTYDQFDLYSCREVFDKVRLSKPDGVIIGPTFQQETTELCSALDQEGIPYIFVDSAVADTKPLSFYSADNYKMGRLMGKLLDYITPKGSEFALFKAVRVGDANANTTLLRQEGFLSYFTDELPDSKVHHLPFSVNDPQKNEELIGDFFEKNPQVKGVITLNSRGVVIADYIAGRPVPGIKLICVDLTLANIKALYSGRIDFVIAQRPQQQGYKAVTSLMTHLVYASPPDTGHYMPLDILTQENLDFYREFGEAQLPE